jgi:hypothetical protein
MLLSLRSIGPSEPEAGNLFGPLAEDAQTTNQEEQLADSDGMSVQILCVGLSPCKNLAIILFSKRTLRKADFLSPK